MVHSRDAHERGGNSRSVKCHHCRRTFSTESARDRHSAFHNRPSAESGNASSCKIRVSLGTDGVCKFRGNFEQMKRHLEEDHGVEGAFYCDRCPYKCTWKYLLDSHVNKSHGIRKRSVYQCPFCHHAAANRNGLWEHQSAVHGNKRDGYRCHLCEWTGRSRSHDSRCLKEHLRKRHGMHVSAARAKGENGADGTTDCRCEVCGMVLSSRQSLASHLVVHSRLEACKICAADVGEGKGGGAFRGDFEAMRVHVEENHGRQGAFACRLCYHYVTNWHDR